VSGQGREHRSEERARSGAPRGSEPSSAVTTPAVRSRRELAVAVVLGAAAGALALSSAGQTWARLTVVRRPPLPPVGADLTGGQLAPLVTATGLLLLAAAIALFAVRGLGRIVVGLFMAVAGGVLAWSGLRPLVGELAVDAGSVVSAGDSPDSRVSTAVSAGWPLLALAAGVLGVLAGLVVVVRGRGWPAMGRRYEREGAAGPDRPGRPMTDDDRAAAAWRALDRGEDPTDVPDQARDGVPDGVPDDGPVRPA
jgi:uncharacterized membrane protein (TIGR02234 family)